MAPRPSVRTVTAGLDLLSSKVRRMSLEGIIGAGKSHALKNLRKQFAGNHQTTLTVVDEPVSEWCKTTDQHGKSVLSYFYDDIERYAFMFQINALMTRYSATTRANDTVRSLVLDSQMAREAAVKPIAPAPVEHVILSERTIATDREVFAQMLRESGKLNEIEHSVYRNTYDTLVARRPECAHIDGVVYIHTTPTQAKERIDKRNREGENVGFEYLCDCETAHHEWLATANYPVLIVDGSVDAADPRYTQVMKIAETFLTTDPEVADSSLLPPTSDHWQTAIRWAECSGVALYDITRPSVLGQEVQGVDGLRLTVAVADVAQPIDGVAERFPEEDPLEEPTPVYACL